MSEMIKAMVDALKEQDADYISIDIGEYSIFVTTKETAECIYDALDESEVAE